MADKTPINIMVGRFQPFTVGHLKCVETAFKHNGLPVLICMVSNTKFDSKHHFTDELIAQEMSLVKDANSKMIYNTQPVTNGNISGIVYHLNNAGYDVKGLVCGTDRVDSYTKAVELARKKPARNPFSDDFEIIEVKRGDEDVSATKVRKAIASNDIATYKKLMPIGDKLFGEFQEQLNLISETHIVSLTNYIKEHLEY